VFNTVVVGLVIVGRSPAGRKARERDGKNQEFAGETRMSTIADGNFARALGQAGIGPFPVIGVQDQKPPGLDELGPDGLSGSTMEVGGSGMGGDNKRWGEIDITGIGQAILRGDEVRERSKGHTQEDSRDRSEHNSSGLKLATQYGVCRNFARYGVEEKSES